jgi:hypothetical protein
VNISFLKVQRFVMHAEFDLIAGFQNLTNSPHSQKNEILNKYLIYQCSCKSKQADEYSDRLARSSNESRLT